MTHRASRKFWAYYNALPSHIQKLADENFKLLKADPRHPSIQFKKAGRFWSARVGINFRPTAVQRDSDFVWFWIGHHSEYDRIMAGK